MTAADNGASSASRPAVVMLLNSLSVGGAERQTVALAKLLSERFRVVLATLKPSGGVSVQSSDAGLAEVRCLQVASRIDLRAARELAALAADHDARVILCANTYPLLYTQLARAMSRRGLRVVAVFHTTELLRWKDRLAMLVYRPLFWAAHHLVYVCKAQRAYWSRRALGARQTHVIYNGVSVQHYDPARAGVDVRAQRAAYGFADEDAVVGICAVLRAEKAHGDLLQAVARLRQQGVHWRLLIIGDGPLRAEIEAQAAALGVADRVVITGLQSDVRGAILCCDVMALVSHAVETFSMAALEAMALGKPMIMSDVGGAREQVLQAQTGWVFPAGDIGALAECLRQCRDRLALGRMGAAARERVTREFSEQAMVEHYARVLGQADTASRGVARSGAIA